MQRKLILLGGLLFAPLIQAQDALTLSERVERLESRMGEGGGNMVADLVIEVRTLQQEVRRLHGEIERLKHELEGVKARQRDQYLDLDKRIQALAKQAPVHQPEQARSVPNPVRVEEDEPVPEPAAPPADSTPVESNQSPFTPNYETPSRQTGPMNAQDREASYAAAKSLLLDQRFAEAAEAFREFLQRYPAGPLSDNAQYWLGESYYVTGNFDLALNAFQAVISRFPDSTKRADALLKIGYTYYEMEQWQQARDTLMQVVAEYPDTSEARLANSRLRLLRIKTADLP